ncbi:MAG: 3-deoxy-8-phosphooctulonate synthase [Myxococcota bacterium]|nr:3-deoxy-8-phosphooctulonate synthase [Myxococcota bacterium]
MTPAHPTPASSATRDRSDKMFYVLGPCVIESGPTTLEIASEVARQTRPHRCYFKASFDKANRTRLDAFRGLGLSMGLQILGEAREASQLPVITDVHECWQVEKVAPHVDALQVPAFLCRQSSLLLEVGSCGLPVLIKKGQFLSATDMRHVADKVLSAGAPELWLCERGSTQAGKDLYVDMRNLCILREIANDTGARVVYDATHSVQHPGLCHGTGGHREYVLPLLRAAVAVGIDGVFAELHPAPETALCDADCQWPLSRLPELLQHTEVLDKARRALEVRGTGQVPNRQEA